MAITVTGKNLTIENVVAVARHGERVELHPEASERIVRCRTFLDQRIAAREIMYGVNTGIGEFSEVVLDDDQVRDFQRYLIYNHAAGIGDPCPEDHVRAAMLLRVNVHANGHSGCRPEITECLVAMLNAGVTPVVCEKGSVGACGDLAPMSQIALLLMGEGEAFFKGKRLPGATALEAAGIPVPGLQARDHIVGVGSCRDDHDRDIADLADLVTELEPAQPREQEVHEHNVLTLAVEEVERFLGRLGLVDVVPLLLQREPQ